MEKFPILCVIFFANIVFGKIPNNISRDGLIGFWEFNGNAKDESGNKINGHVANANMTVDRYGNKNAACQFSNNNCQIIFKKNIAKLPIQNNPRTISAWIKTSTEQAGIIWDFGTLENGKRFSLQCIDKYPIKNGSTRVYFSAQFFDIFGTRNIADCKWHNIILVYNTNEIIIYIDGNIDVRTNTFNQFSEQNVSILNTSIKYFSIGNRIEGDEWDEYFTGTIDDIAIWNRALSEDEIKKYINTN